MDAPGLHHAKDIIHEKEGARKIQPLDILFGDDGSQDALSAISFIRDLPFAENSSLFTLGVLSQREGWNIGLRQADIEQTQVFLSEKGLDFQSQIVMGNPAEKLLEFADARQPDLIVLGAKGRRNTFDILLGGVTQQVMEYSDVPVLVVRSPYKGLRRLMLLTDGSDCSMFAAKFLAHFPVPDWTEIRIAHVLPPLLFSADRFVQKMEAGKEVIMPISEKKLISTAEVQAKEERFVGETLLNNTMQMMKELGITTTPVLMHGDAATEIIAYARENEIDLIVAGARGITASKAWLIGSVSRKLAHYSGCSILIVKQTAR